MANKLVVGIVWDWASHKQGCGIHSRGYLTLGRRFAQWKCLFIKCVPRLNEGALRDEWNDETIASEDLERKNQTEKEVPSGWKSRLGDWLFLPGREEDSLEHPQVTRSPVCTEAMPTSPEEYSCREWWIDLPDTWVGLEKLGTLSSRRNSSCYFYVKAFHSMSQPAQTSLLRSSTIWWPLAQSYLDHDSSTTLVYNRVSPLPTIHLNSPSGPQSSHLPHKDWPKAAMVTGLPLYTHLIFQILDTLGK